MTLLLGISGQTMFYGLFPAFIAGFTADMDIFSPSFSLTIPSVSSDSPASAFLPFFHSQDHLPRSASSRPVYYNVCVHAVASVVYSAPSPAFVIFLKRAVPRSTPNTRAYIRALTIQVFRSTVYMIPQLFHISRRFRHPLLFFVINVA